MERHLRSAVNKFEESPRKNPYELPPVIESSRTNVIYNKKDIKNPYENRTNKYLREHFKKAYKIERR